MKKLFKWVRRLEVANESLKFSQKLNIPKKTWRRLFEYYWHDEISWKKYTITSKTFKISNKLSITITHRKYAN